MSMTEVELAAIAVVREAWNFAVARTHAQPPKTAPPDFDHRDPRYHLTRAHLAMIEALERAGHWQRPDRCVFI